jgi:hypothetical protein
MGLLEAIFVKPHKTFLKTILKEHDLSYEDIKGLLKTIDEDLEILLPKMNQVNKMIKSNRTSNAKWCECRITLTHLIDCMVTVLPVIQAALNDAINESDWRTKKIKERATKLNQLRLNPSKIIDDMMRVIHSESDSSKIVILSEAAALFSSMLLICNQWLKTMIVAEFELS